MQRQVASRRQRLLHRGPALQTDGSFVRIAARQYGHSPRSLFVHHFILSEG